MDTGTDMDIMPKEQLVLLKDLIAIVTIANVKKDIFIAVVMGMEDTVSLVFFKLKCLKNQIYFQWKIIRGYS